MRILILKARQIGFSTLVEAIIFWKTATKQNTDSMIVAHKDEATANLFRMSKLFYEMLPAPIRPMKQASNAQELVFDRPSNQKGHGRGIMSRIRCATAGGTGVGRSYTLKNVHMSEFAYWPGNKMETYTGIMQTVPDLPDTMVVIESTANGYDEFKTMWDAAVEAQAQGDENGWVPIFFPWHEMSEYRRTPPPGFTPTEEERKLAEAFGLDDEQLAWRRWCIAVNCGGDLNLFRQEYPATPDEAFIATGSCVFDKERIVLRREEVRGLEWERGMFRYDYRERDGRKISNIRWGDFAERLRPDRKASGEGEALCPRRRHRGHRLGQVHGAGPGQRDGGAGRRPAAPVRRDAVRPADVLPGDVLQRGADRRRDQLLHLPGEGAGAAWIQAAVRPAAGGTPIPER